MPVNLWPSSGIKYVYTPAAHLEKPRKVGNLKVNSEKWGKVGNVFLPVVFTAVRCTVY